MGFVRKNIYCYDCGKEVPQELRWKTPLGKVYGIDCLAKMSVKRLENIFRETPELLKDLLPKTEKWRKIVDKQ